MIDLLQTTFLWRYRMYEIKKRYYFTIFMYNTMLLSYIITSMPDLFKSLGSIIHLLNAYTQLSHLELGYVTFS